MEVDNSFELKKLAVQIANVTIQEISKTVDDMPYNLSDKLTLEMMAVSALMAVVVKSQYQYTHTEITFDDFKEHCFDCIRIFLKYIYFENAH